MKKIFNHLDLVAFLLILVLGFVVRLYKIDIPLADWHSWRQSDTAAVSRIYVDEGINILVPKYYDISTIQSGWSNPNGYRFVEFPMYNFLHAFSFNAFPQIQFEIWGRLISVFVTIIAAYYMYLLGNKFLGKWGGVFASFFLLFTPYAIFFSRTILPEPAILLFVVASIYYFARFMDEKNLFFLAVAGVFFSLSMLMKPYIAFYGISLLYLFFREYNWKDLFSKKNLLVKMMLFLLIIFLPFFLWRVWMNKYAAGIPHFEWAFNGDNIRFHPAFWRWLFIERLGKLILGVWALPLFLLGAIKVWKNNWFIQSLLLSVFAYLAVVATANVRHDYYQYITMPAVALTLASGVMFILKSKEINRLLGSLGILVSVSFMLYAGWYQAKDYYQVNHPEIIVAGKRADEILPKDARVIAPYNGDTAFLYQTKRYGWPVLETNWYDLINRGADYYVSVDLGSSDTKSAEDHFAVVEKTDRYIIVNLHDVKKPINKK